VASGRDGVATRWPGKEWSGGRRPAEVGRGEPIRPSKTGDWRRGRVHRARRRAPRALWSASGGAVDEAAGVARPAAIARV